MILRRAHARHGLLGIALALALGALAWPPSVRSQDRPGRPESFDSAAAPRVEGDGPPIPKAVGFVNDRAGVLDEPSRAKLEAFLDQLKRKTGVEFAVLIMPTTAPATPSEYKVKVFERWGIGQRGQDNGLLMLVAVAEHEVRFETGYGLEGTLPDGLQSRIVREEMAPRLRAGEYFEAVTAGVLACARRIAAEQGVTLEWDGRELRYEGSGSRPIPGWLILLLAVIVLMVLLRGGRGGRWRGGMWTLPGGPWVGMGGSRGGWGGFGGGGFGGGGFGGGSFGGFGGGMSGGGGGGGKW
jgi:uncharacterized protein